jgi:catechol 2,3-dioxygenase-like lactoylglutathione lyase family enzyme
MRISKLAWVGTRTENAEPTVAFFRDVLGLRLELERPGFWMLKLPDGSKVEVFGPDSPINRHFTTGPVAGFLVDDVQDAAAELRAAGVEILFESVEVAPAGTPCRRENRAIPSQAGLFSGQDEAGGSSPPRPTNGG